MRLRNRRRPAHFRPELRRLEDRLAPAVLYLADPSAYTDCPAAIIVTRLARRVVQISPQRKGGRARATPEIVSIAMKVVASNREP